MSERKFQMGKIADTVKVLVAEVDRKRRDLRNIVDVFGWWILTARCMRLAPKKTQKYPRSFVKVISFHKRKFPMLLLCLFTSVPENCLSSVSYTHLDVYKRQIHRSLTC